MKKIFILATAAIVAFASCTKSEVVYNQGQQEIGFRQFTGSMTKGDPTNLSELVGGPTTMGVYAHISDGNQAYFSNAKFVKPTDASNNWGGEPKRYWPLQDKLDFTVYAPYVDGTTYNATNAQLTVQVATNTTAQEDFLYGVKRYTDQGKTAVAVPVVLRHALSKLTFKVKSNVSGLFKITKVELVDAVQDGSFTVTYGATPDIAVSTGSTKGTCNVYAAEAASSLSVTESYQDLGSKLVFPIGSGSNEAKLRITYNMVDATGLVAVVNLNHDWSNGKHYTYSVDITATQILLSPSVEDWDPVPVEGHIEIK